jgi:division protein CdvB (Snf7/Vps24/ESCRT-III family)
MLTENEQARLDAIKAEMDALDAASDANRVWERQIERIHQQLTAIRREVESLPDAP